jgi:hypothetical protein
VSKAKKPTHRRSTPQSAAAKLKATLAALDASRADADIEAVLDALKIVVRKRYPAAARLAVQAVFDKDDGYKDIADDPLRPDAEWAVDADRLTGRPIATSIPALPRPRRCTTPGGESAVHPPLSRSAVSPSPCGGRSHENHATQRAGETPAAPAEACRGPSG